MSRDSAPVGITSTSMAPLPSSGMIAPLPNCFSIAAIAAATALSLSLPFMDSLLVERSQQRRPSQNSTQAHNLVAARARGLDRDREQRVVLRDAQMALAQAEAGAATDLPFAELTLGPGA